MAKKRKTLPKNFDELIKAKDMTALKAVFDVSSLYLVVYTHIKRIQRVFVNFL
jgi:hypothetical protein